MDIERVTVLNLENGQVGVLRKSLFENPVFNVGQLVEVDPDQKSYIPELWKPHTLEEWEARKVFDAKAVEDDPIFDSLISPPTHTEDDQ